MKVPRSPAAVIAGTPFWIGNHTSPARDGGWFFRLFKADFILWEEILFEKVFEISSVGFVFIFPDNRGIDHDGAKPSAYTGVLVFGHYNVGFV